MDKEAKYWKCEYENLRRKKKKEIENLKLEQAKMCDITYDLLIQLGMKPQEIFDYYKMKNGKELEQKI